MKPKDSMKDLYQQEQKARTTPEGVSCQKAGYKKIWTKDAFSFYGDLRPLAVEAKFGKWGNNGLIYNENYKNDFLLTEIK